MAVRVPHIGPVVVGVVVGPEARRALVPRAGSQRRGMEGIDGRAITRLEGERRAIADARWCAVDRPQDPELRRRVRRQRIADLTQLRGAVLPCDAEDLQQGVVEGDRAGEIVGPQGDMAQDGVGSFRSWEPPP